MDDIQEYMDARYIGPPETVWRLLQFHERTRGKRPMIAVELEKDCLTKDRYGLQGLRLLQVPRADHVIKLPPLQKLPPQLQELFDGDDARSISLRNHSRPFVIREELKHRSGPLLPFQGRHTMYSQLYVYDPDDAKLEL